MSRINQTTFKYDKRKRVICRNCGSFIGTTHLGEMNSRTVKCSECKNFQLIVPPRYGKLNDKNGIFWCEPSDTCWTAIPE